MDTNQASVLTTSSCSESSPLVYGLASETTTLPLCLCVTFQFGMDITGSLNFTELKTLEDGPWLPAKALLSYHAPHATNLSSTCSVKNSAYLRTPMTAAGPTSPSVSRTTPTGPTPWRHFSSTARTEESSSHPMSSSPTETSTSTSVPLSV